MRLIGRHPQLPVIRGQLETLDDAEILSLAESPASKPADSALDYIRQIMSPSDAAAEPSIAHTHAAAPPDAPLPATAPTEPAVPAPDLAAEVRIERSQWERIVVGRDVELHIRRPLPRSTAKRIDRLLSIARDLLEEDPS